MGEWVDRWVGKCVDRCICKLGRYVADALLNSITNSLKVMEFCSLFLAGRRAGGKVSLREHPKVCNWLRK